jgi:hypothetical protein
MKLKSLHRWLFGARALKNEDALRSWTVGRGWVFKRTHEGDGFVVDQPHGPAGWRMEWGPSQRQYLGGHELRVRAAVAVDPASYALVMPKALFDSLERELFSQYTGGVQTRLDEETPEEMRWLAMSAKLSATELGELRGRYGAVANTTPWLLDWLAGLLGPALLAFDTGASNSLPMALTVRRGQLVLRLGLAEPTPQDLAQALGLFDLALAEAQRTATTTDRPAE